MMHLPLDRGMGRDRNCGVGRGRGRGMEITTGRPTRRQWIAYRRKRQVGN